VLPDHARPTAAAAAKQVLLGDRFAVTGALRFTGRGGIYQATDLKSGETVVVKQARPHMGAARDGLDSRSFLLNEWSMLHLLADTGITPKPVALLQQAGDLFIAEEFLSGTRMDRWAQRYQPGPNPPGEHAEFRAVVASLCEVVREFHSRGLVIRDLTPDNLFVGGGQVRVCDVEYVAFSGTLPRTMGTPGFVAPEVRLRDMVSQAADLYALGALFFTLCAGLPPYFADDEPDGPTGDGQHRRTRADRLAALLSRIPDSSPLLDMMSEVIVALLADDPEARPPAAEVAARLRRDLGETAVIRQNGERSPLARNAVHAPRRPGPHR
jgi:serine/threonine protein kinase